MLLVATVIRRSRLIEISAMLILYSLPKPSLSTPSMPEHTDCFNVGGQKVMCADAITEENVMTIALEDSKVRKAEEEATTKHNDYNYDGNYGYEDEHYDWKNYNNYDYNSDYYNHENTANNDKQKSLFSLHEKIEQQNGKFELDYPTVVALSSLPQHCIFTEFPNKLQQVLGDKGDLLLPSDLHPIFYGCFDWHSSVHGHWLLVRALALFPDTELADNVTSILQQQLTEDKVIQERSYFSGPGGTSFERTYGWAWLLKLQEELWKLGSDHDVTTPCDKCEKKVTKSKEDTTEMRNEKLNWYSSLTVLSEHISSSFKQFLPKLVYPIRVGEHTNTAFGLSLALDYARTVKDKDLENLIFHNATGFYRQDRSCPLDWEPSGFDFLSPCLQEADLMSQVIQDDGEFFNWVSQFLPQLFDPDFTLEPGHVVDRTDGKLVHLDGLNFSRAWCLYSVGARLAGSTRARLILMGDNHVEASRDAVVGSNYMGSHWLATFLLRALEKRKEAIGFIKQ